MRRRAKQGDPKCAIAYMRVSTCDQTVDPQRDAIERWASQNGVRVAAWYSDVGVGGDAPLDERPSLLEALNALREHGAGLFVTAKRDRLARDVGSAAAIERLALESGSRVATADGLDASDSPEGQLIRSIVDAMAVYERLLIGARTKAALRSKAARGECIGPAPIGFSSTLNLRADRTAMLLHAPAEQAAIAVMRSMRAEGATLQAIADALNDDDTHRAAARKVVGKRTTQGRWHASTVMRVLRRAS